MSFARANALLVASVVLLACGMTFVGMGWYGAAYTNIPSEQTPFLISGGLLGLGLIIVSGFLAVGARLERQHELLRKEIGRALSSRPFDAAADATPQGSNGTSYFVVDGGKSYHVPGCPILEGKQAVRIGAADKGGYASCKLCGD